MIPNSKASVLVNSFVHKNPNWPMNTLVRYVHQTYTPFLQEGECMNAIISNAFKRYIDSVDA